MLTPGSSYDEVRKSLDWSIPKIFNIGVQVCDKWADSGRLALIFKTAEGQVENYSFGDLKTLSNKLANVLNDLGLERGERVGILLPQAPETAITHIAAYKMGAIAIPLFTLFGEEALEYRLSDSGAQVVVTDRAGAAKLALLRERLPVLSHVLCIDDLSEGDSNGLLDFHALLEPASSDFTPVETLAEDPALIIYTSGTTGPPKGALHAHRVLLGHLPGVEFPHEFFPQADDLFWTPADWAWIGGLLDVLLPAWYHGVPVLAHRFAKFEPEAAFSLMAEFKVRNAFMPPTALKMMRSVERPRERWDCDLRSIGSGGESLGEELLAWGRETFGLTINEFYGQTECNLVVGNCAGLMPVKPGAMGRAVPGHEVAIVDDAGTPLPQGEEGNIGIQRPDPVMFLRYWNNPEATEKKFVGDWLLTGDRGRLDEDGYFHFVGRDDDVITSGGYRIGPGEIEDCLIKHPAIAMAAAVGIPDPLRTERVKAFVVLNPGFEGGDDLAREIQAFVKIRLAAHEYPRDVAFVENLPMTTTGKIIRRELREREVKKGAT
ncbi:acyl-CoA synthetase [Pelagibius sp. Alg239-R121]|uniref:acyl-CoA synthetase n=1 Tax=Pelagibius sp. Alg239-R121 TaxID=2993448 RepID=UPI0024A64DCB|nr:acyl-CoA synthetase [Pelagibius sp. Alg239-R121]